MSATWNVDVEVTAELVGETEDGLVEVGAVSAETKGGPVGFSNDLGAASWVWS